jgi:predicted nucleotidyltransferase
MVSTPDPTTAVASATDGRTLADWVPAVVDRIFERCAARRVIVFGSVVRGEAHADSDIDLLVVLDHVANSHRDAVRIMRELRDLPVAVDVIVTDDQRLITQARTPGVVRVALREGTVFERAA